MGWGGGFTASQMEESGRAFNGTLLCVGERGAVLLDTRKRKVKRKRSKVSAGWESEHKEKSQSALGKRRGN